MNLLGAPWSPAASWLRRYSPTWYCRQRDEQTKDTFFNFQNQKNQKTYKWGGLLSFKLKEGRADVFLAILIPF